MINKPYGSWKSPISGKSLVQSSLRLGQIQIDDESIYWSEGRPAEKGRTALMTWTDNKIHEITSDDSDVRTRAHEYGGGAFLCVKEHYFYINNSDQQIYEVHENGEPRQVTNHPEYRFADMILDQKRGSLYVVGENHADSQNIKNCLLRITLDGGGLQIIAEGHDFFSNPQLSPDGSQLLFLAWDHPNMPWDGTQLQLADLDFDGNIARIQELAGGMDESIFQPQWDPDGSIYFISDRNGWWNIYRYYHSQITCILESEAEFGLPQWVFGMSKYAVLNTGDLVAAYSDLSGSHLLRIDVQEGTSIEIKTHYTHIDQVKGSKNHIAFIGHTDSQPGEVVTMDLDEKTSHTIRKAAEIDINESYISKAQHVSFESAPDELTHAWFYPPRNPDYEARSGDLPPLIVLSHGGPTGNSSGAFSLAIQYWTSRGFAIVDVNYSGSTGYGRQYRERLKGNWGVRDVHDCATAAKYLVGEGLVDKERLIIKGGSAGGYTTLAALTFLDVFKAGASYYGVGDLTLLARDTHKFESRYLDSMIGPYPEEKQLYIDRSPLNFADQLDCPVIFMQGLDDSVVPPDQAKSMVAALKNNGIPVAYLPFEGESHGFRQATTVVKAIESEYYFYTRIFGIDPVESVEPIEIFNLG
ncbi:MAG: S9 family peptidase [Candidatus Marinimicrobia bacterium]|jgi:dipeptidyl aminopeptidase/acylaminoacyl peptidase|nr:S9 family peptidase [Candidatus Neomarinimicrobiota bacterium]MBT3632028.1 S9 family peptidase [Candidatus Neomarinimicrobiota bacterium]MBT3824614.1 S9 family peptidase [Candidatus Neomarinimicrobiota bacterium]MBT4130212.1 S9 family peptidase [Candidatus Neomarinimicrobiota bacterium]MBT4296962.1 S9 family peptidase [Candidatus Neomarinimicrobiota bacterium]